MNVSDLMHSEVVTISSKATVLDAIRKLSEWDIRHLPVVDDGRLVGIVSDRDLREYRLPPIEELKHPDYTQDMMDTPISELMNDDIIYLTPDESIRTAIDSMLNYQLGALPVLEEKDQSSKLLGMISYVDILRNIRDAV